MAKESVLGLKSKKNNFSEWFSEIIARAELADMRYNVKGFLVHRPLSVLAMKAMYDLYENALEAKGHEPVWFPAVIPKQNFLLEADHVKGFTPEVFWVTESGDGKKLLEPVALRPTSETAMYRMYSLWIRSYRDLPLKLYQSCQVWRHETKATRPFIRGREFYWIETHCAFATKQDAESQVKQDMEMAKDVLLGEYGIPFIFMKRPEWDKFAGAVYTYAADTLMPDGKVLQQPSTHLLGQNFSKPFDVKYLDQNEKESFVWQTVYGIAIWRILASVIAIHGDDKGLQWPFNIAPVQVIIVPITLEKDIVKKCKSMESDLRKVGLRARTDLTDNTPGWKYNEWELKGVPVRLEIGSRELKGKKATLVRRDTGEKKAVSESNLYEEILAAGKVMSEKLKAKAEKDFKKRIKEAKSYSELKSILKGGGLVKASFCSIDRDGEPCADKIQEEMHGLVRGVRLDRHENPADKCIVCGKKAGVVVYIGKQY